MIKWLRNCSLPTKILIFVSAATLLTFFVVGVYATSSVVLQGGVSFLGRKGPQPPVEGAGATAEREDAATQPKQEQVASQPEQEQVASQPEQEQVASQPEQEQVASQQDETEYLGTVGEIQTDAVETFLKSHDKLLQYDALAAGDVEEMKANETALQDMADQAANLAPPRKYEEQHEVFGSAIDELREAARLAYDLAADPVAATELRFDEYDGHVNEASTLLQRSNELLGKNYEAIEGVREISPDFSGQRTVRGLESA